MEKTYRKYVKISLIGILSLTILFTILTNIVTSTQSVQNLNFVGRVNTDILNVRQGPGTNYEINTTLNKDARVNVIGKVDEWYLIQTSNNVFGLCNEKYIDNVAEYSVENEILNSINKQREKQGIKKLAIDNKLNEIAKVKAQDIIDNEYFSHDSNKFGTPLDMLNKYDVKFMTVGENIAKGNEMKEIIKLVTTSKSYTENALSNDYNYTGIAILPIDEYEKIYVQIFIGRQ